MLLIRDPYEKKNLQIFLTEYSENEKKKKLSLRRNK